MTQLDLIKEYLKKYPNKDIHHPEVVGWATEQWKKKNRRSI